MGTPWVARRSSGGHRARGRQGPLLATRRALSLLLVACAIAGCGIKVTQVQFALDPKPNHCQVTEIRASGLSTLISGVCWDKDAKVIGMAGAGGKPAISVPLDLAQSASYVIGPSLGAWILGQGLIKAAGNVHVGGAIDVKSPQLERAIQQGSKTLDNQGTKP